MVSAENICSIAALSVSKIFGFVFGGVSWFLFFVFLCVGVLKIISTWVNPSSFPLAPDFYELVEDFCVFYSRLQALHSTFHQFTRGKSSPQSSQVVFTGCELLAWLQFLWKRFCFPGLSFHLWFLADWWRQSGQLKARSVSVHGNLGWD